MIRRLSLTFSLMLLMALLVACGSSGTPAATNAGTGTGTGGDAVTIVWRTRPSDAAEQQVYEELNKLANEQLKGKNITVQYDPGVNQQYEEKLKLELKNGNAPDIVWIPGASVADYAAANQALDIKPFIDKDTSFKLDDFYPQPIAELTHDGKIYGLPRDISTMVVYYNADIFKAAGLETPAELDAKGEWDMDKLMEYAQKLTDPSKQQYGLGFGNWWGPSWGYFTNAFGGGMFNANRTACNLSSPESVAGAQFVSDLYSKGLVPAGDADGEALFNAGKVAMYMNGRWFTPGVRQNAAFAWDVAQQPDSANRSTWLFWGPYMVNGATKNPDAAWEVLKVITSPEAMARVAEMGTNIPARSNQQAVDAFLKSTPPANNQAFLDSVDYAAAEQALWTGNWAKFQGDVQPLWDQLIAGQLSAEEFGKQACETTTGAFNK